MPKTSAFIKPLIVIAITCLGAGGVAVYVASRGTATIKLHCRVHGLDVGGLTTEAAAKKIRTWWETERRLSLELAWPEGIKRPKNLGPKTATELGVTIDDVATIGQLPTRDLGTAAKDLLHIDESSTADFPIKLRSVKVDLSELEGEINTLTGPFQAARIGWADGQLIRKHESTKYEFDAGAMPAAVAEAINAPGSAPSEVVLPIHAAAKHIPDAELDKITDLVSSFTTHFPARQSNRNNNIKVASGKLNGIILLPGERLSFNTTVGERTVKAGFQEAGIYKNGKHDKGIGGGICQVSSTLYNAALFGNIKIVHHHNHSMPVAYVPIGRDATVNYGVIDLVLENPYPNPIAITSAYQAGVLTFRIFGVADPNLSIKIEREGLTDWDQPVQNVVDPHLQPGQTLVVEKGSRGHKVKVYRLVYHNGELVKREPLGQSYYKPATKIIAHGPGTAFVPTTSVQQTP